MANVSLIGLNKGGVLAALYNASKPQGMGFMQYDPKPMTVAEAQKILDGGQEYFDYHKGRVMKVDLSGDELNTWGYNRDNGVDAAEKAIQTLRESGNENDPAIRATHNGNTLAAAVDVEKRLDQETTAEVSGGVVTMKLGLSDVKHVLAPAVQQVTGRRN